MSDLPLYEEDFVYSAPSPKENRPLRLLAFDSSTTSKLVSLLLFDAEQEHEFFAVSYAWGDSKCKPSFGLNGSVFCATATHGTPLWTNNKALCNNYLSSHRSGSDGYVDILINGKKFYVQDTVYRLLQTLWASKEIQQRLHEGEYFWLDAICVNQNDKLETEQQTSIMHEIYKAAQHVYVWLGTAYNSSDMAMDFLSHLAPSTSPQESATNSTLRTQSHLKDQYWPLYFLFIRPYWKRTWVIQEFLLARDATLLCGNMAVPWSKAEYLVSRLDSDHEFRKRYPQWTATPAVKIIQARKAFLSSRVKPSLVATIQHFLFSKSTYPEDKLLGLLNVSLSNVQTAISRKSGSIQRRVEVINNIVRASQDRGMDYQTAQEWQDLLSCLLGVRGMVPKPERSPKPKPERSPKPEKGPKPKPKRVPRTKAESSPGPKPEKSLMFEKSLRLIPEERFDTLGVLNPSLSQRKRGPAATIAPCAGTPIQNQTPKRAYAATSYPVNIIGSIQSVRPVPTPAQLIYETYKHPLPTLHLMSPP